MARQADQTEDSVRGLSSVQDASTHAKVEETKADFLDPEAPLMKVVPLSIGVGRAAWPQVGFQMCTSVAGAALLGLPYAMSLLTWAPGMIALLMGFAVTLWTSRIIARFATYGGEQHLRYRDLAGAVMGRRLGKAIVWPCQWLNLFGALVSVFIQGGLSFKAIYTLCGGTSMTLTEFIAILGGLAMLFTQMPTFHSLWIINSVNLVVVICLGWVAFIVAIYQTVRFDLPRDYGLHTTPADKAFGTMTGVAIMHFAYGNTIIPEIQATAKPPVVKTMNKAIWMLYAELAALYLPSAIIGYAAYGAALSDGGSFMPFFQATLPSSTSPIPKWALILVNVLVVVNAIAGVLIYAAPITEHFETKVLDAKSSIWSFKNWFKRTLLRCAYMFFSAFVAALIPFFGDILALVGALGITPIDFLLPLVLYVFYTHPRPATHWLVLNGALIVLYTLVMIAGAAAAIRGIILDAQTYKVFANL